MTDADILRCVQVLDKRKAEGRPKKTTSNEVISGRTSGKTAKIVGTSKTKVEKVRTVLDHGDEEVKKAVEKGEVNILRRVNPTTIFIKARRIKGSDTNVSPSPTPQDDSGNQGKPTEKRDEKGLFVEGTKPSLAGNQSRPMLTPLAIPSPRTGIRL